MAFGDILYEKRDAIATITINRPVPSARSQRSLAMPTAKISAAQTDAFLEKRRPDFRAKRSR